MNNLVGIDIVECNRIKEKMNDRFINRILSPLELEVFNTFKSDKRKIEGAYLPVTSSSTSLSIVIAVVVS